MAGEPSPNQTIRVQAAAPTHTVGLDRRPLANERALITLATGLADNRRGSRYRDCTQPIRVVRVFRDDLHGQALLAPNSLPNYRGTVSLFDEFCSATLDLEDITPEEAGRFFQWLRYEKHREPNTVCKHRRQLVAILREARRTKFAKLKVTQVPRVKRQKKLPRAWTPDQFAIVIDDASRLPGQVGRWPLRYWFPSLCLTAWSTDWRISACMALPTTRVNIDTGAIVSYEEKTSEERVAWLTPQALEFLRKIWDPARREVYGDWPYDRTKPSWPALTKILKGIIQRTGVPDIGRFHAIRRTSTTAVAVTSGIDAAADHAGHTHHSVTRASYVDPTHLAPSESKLPVLSLSKGGNQMSLF
ncbi:MAG: tyrosine-type recombinase/integrase [Pirellulales bacterium]